MVSTQLRLSLLLLSTSAPAVFGHGGMVTPESREIRTMGLDIDSSFGWPIAMRPGGDCLDNTPDTNLQTIPYGQSKIEMRANDGANHIGPCTVYLVNPDDTSDKLQVGQLDDCMRSLHPEAGNKGDAPIPAEMSIDVPQSGLPCSPGHCVLEFYWEATHLDPHELFNNCADVKLGGGSSASAADNESGSTAASPEAPSEVSDAPNATTAAPANTSAPASSGTYVSIGTDGSMKAPMDQWCNQNCNNDPPYCPESSCTAA
jgi:predicted carbohydrate-binding protein with CBM5 and CBM33 domain